MPWAKDHKVCAVCGRDDSPHRGHGYCRRCYNKAFGPCRDRSPSATAEPVPGWHPCPDSLLRIVEDSANGMSPASIVREWPWTVSPAVGEVARLAALRARWVARFRQTPSESRPFLRATYLEHERRALP